MSDRVRFREVSESSGLVFRHRTGGSGEYYQPETDGSGLVIFDYDEDGDPDVLFRDGGEFPGYQGPPPATRLFRNEGAGRFVDVTESTGIVSRALFGMGATAGDIDGDGDLDLYLTGVGENQLYENRGDGTFVDVTAASGTAETRWSSSAGFADPDGDGDLDLYVVNYLGFDLVDRPNCTDPKTGRRSFCHPDAFDAVPDRYFVNRGDGSFVDGTAAAGFGLSAAGKGLGLVFSDVDDDGWPDLYIANDTTPNQLFLNRGDGSFEDHSLLSGAAFGMQAESEAGMGIAPGDYDGDGRIDFYVTNYALETNALYRNVGNGTFVDFRHPTGLSGPTIRSLGFGASFADFDHDGLLELVVANGHVLDNVEQIREHITYRQKNQLFVPDANGRFTECIDCGLDAVRVSRGLATGDLDDDGDLDLVISNSNDFAEVYENVSELRGAWLTVSVSSPSGNRHGVGTRVTVLAAESQAVREISTASSYLSQSELRVHFGLPTGSATDRLWIDTTTVRRGGDRVVFRLLPANRRVELHTSRRLHGDK